MRDALRALVDAVGVDARSGTEVRSDDAWTLDLGPTAVHHWVATRHRPLWVTSGERVELLQPGSAALLAPDTIVTVGSEFRRCALPWSDDEWFGDTGEHVGTVRVGPFWDEAFGLPAIVTTQPPGAPAPDVVVALGHLEESTGGRWLGAQRDAVARLVVAALLHDNPPAWLRDASLAACFDRLLDPGEHGDAIGGRTVRIADLLECTTMSASTLHRRFRASTGCTPDGLRRWFGSLPVRSALAVGEDPCAVAERAGFSRPSAMRRALGRIRAPETSIADDL